MSGVRGPGPSGRRKEKTLSKEIFFRQAQAVSLWRASSRTALEAQMERTRASLAEVRRSEARCVKLWEAARLALLSGLSMAGAGALTARAGGDQAAWMLAGLGLILLLAGGLASRRLQRHLGRLRLERSALERSLARLGQDLCRLSQEPSSPSKAELN